MHDAPRLIQLFADTRVGSLVTAPNPAFVLDGEGRLLLANRASLTLLRAASAADVAATVAAERGRIASTLRRVLEGPADGPAQRHALSFVVAGARKATEFTCSRILLADGGVAVLLVGTEPAGNAPDVVAALAALIDGQHDAFVVADGGGKLIHVNARAASLVAAASNLADIVPGIHRALAVARDQGLAELSFGVLRVFIHRVGPESNPLYVAAIAAPARTLQETEIVAAPVPAEPDSRHEAAREAEPAQTIAEQETPLDAEPESSAPEKEAVDDGPATAGPADQDPSPDVQPGEAAQPEADEAATRPPSRFVWQTDAEGRFTSVSAELAAVVGPEAAAIAGLTWPEAATRFEIEGADAVVAAIKRRDTWSGASVLWPVADSELVRPVDLAALPVFDRERRFLGYRGFGVFRAAQPRPARERKPPEPTASKPADAAREPTPPPSPAPPPVFIAAPENVVPLHKPTSGSEPPRPALSAGERQAFRDIAKAIGSRMRRVESVASTPRREPAEAPSAPAKDQAGPAVQGSGERAVLDRLPIGVIVHRGERLLYVNRTLLDWLGFATGDELAKAGGLGRLFAGPTESLDQAEGTARPIALRSHGGESVPVEARLLSAPWEGESALVYVLRRAGAGLDERMEAGELALREAEATARELRAILDTATDGVALLDQDGRLLGMNRSAEALFGFDTGEIEGRHFSVLFAPESHRAAADYLDGLAVNGVASVLNDGREVIGRVREGGLIPLFMTLGRVSDGGQKFCAVFRDITQWKRAEEELVHARREAERASSAKSEFLAKISHEIRTPLNAIIGFAEVMMEERLGPIVNERYREYLKDIHASGEHLVSLINDLLDLSKIEAGKLDLAFASVDLNEIASQSMALMQPQANRERIIIRTALSTNLPPVVADARSIRQIVLNLLSNSIRFTPPGGQVIVSTTLTDAGEVHLRVRDTGIGMSETEIKTALEPFRQIATASRGKAGGTGLGLPLTKALVEANRASFAIKSTVNAGTLIEIAFPSTRVLAE